MCYIMTKTPGEIIRDLREQRGLTQEDLAELVDVSQNYKVMKHLSRFQPLDRLRDL